MTIAAILIGRHQNVVAAHVAQSVREVVALMVEHRIGAVPVVEGGGVVGVFSERDVIRCVASDGAAALDWPVTKVMTAPAVTVNPETSILGALSLMTRRRIRHLPVEDQGRMVGFVSIGDLVKYRIDRIEAEAEAMRAYIGGS